MKRWIAILAAVLLSLFFTAHSAAAAGLTKDDKRASCTNREAPDKANKGEAWLDYHDDGKGGWVVTSVRAKIRSIGLPRKADNNMAVQINDFSKGTLPVGTVEFKRLVNIDWEASRNIYPWIRVPRGN